MIGSMFFYKKNPAEAGFVIRKAFEELDKLGQPLALGLRAVRARYGWQVALINFND